MRSALPVKLRALLSGEPARLAKSLALADQPFDGLLVARSPLYRRARQEYLKAGGVYRPSFVSSARSLNSVALLEPVIEYSPLAREVEWQITDPRASRSPGSLLELRTAVVSLFHETNHRLLWAHLPPPPARGPAVKRYLNLAESLVIALDMALGDELGPKLSGPLYQLGVVYDPGTDWKRRLRGRDARNVLHACAYATYLALEAYEPKQIPAVIARLYPRPGGAWPERAAARALKIDPGFVVRTNQVWQKRYSAQVQGLLKKHFPKNGEPLVLPTDPMDNRLHYLWAESFFARAFGR